MDVDKGTARMASARLASAGNNLRGNWFRGDLWRQVAGLLGPMRPNLLTWLERGGALAGPKPKAGLLGNVLEAVGGEPYALMWKMGKGWREAGEREDLQERQHR